MVEKLEGLTIDLGLNTAGIDEGLKGLQRKLKVVNSEMDANLSAFGKGEKSIERYGATLQGLNRKMEVQSKIVSKAKSDYNDLIKKQDEMTKSIKEAENRVTQSKKAYEELSKSQNVTKKELNEAKKAVVDSEKAYKQLNKELIDMPKAIDNAASEVNKQIKSYNRMKDSVDNTRSALQKLQSEQKQTISGFDKIANKMNSAGDKMESFGSSAMSKGQGMSLGVTAPIAAFGATSIQQAGEYDAASSQFKQVFKGMEKEATTSLDKISEKTGLLPNGLRGTYTQMAAFAKTTGTDTKDAIDLTSRATLAAADSAAFYDKSIEEVSESLQSYLKGNYENDSALGISSTETTRNAKANELYGKSFKDLSEAQKQLTLLKMVEDGNKLSGALGQAAREQDQLGTQTMNAKTAWKDFQAEVGKPILPTAISLLKDLSGAAKGAGKWFGGLSENQKKFTLGLVGIAAATGPSLMAIGAMSSGIGALVKGFGFVGNGFKLFTKNGRETSKVAGAISKVFGGLKSTVGGVSKVFGSVGNVIGKVGPKAFGLLGKSIGGVTKAFKILRLAFATNPLGVVLLGVTALGTGLVWLYKHNEKFRNAVNNMGKQAKKIFGNLVGWVKDLGKNFGKGFGKAVDSVKSFGKNVGKRFGDMKDSAVANTKKLYKGVTGWFGDTRDGIKSRTGKALDWTKRNFENMKDSSISKSKALYKGVSGWMGDIRDRVKNVTGRMRDLAVGNFKSMYSKATDWVRKIGTFLSDFKDNLASKAKSLGKSVANGAISGLNGMIDGINSISSKIMDKKLLSKIPKLSTGTQGLVRNGEITRPTLAVVGDKGPGNGPGGFSHEIIEKKDGSRFLTPATDTLVKLDPGDKVRNGTYTYNAMKQGLIPQFSLGTDLWNGAKAAGSKVKEFGSSVKDTVVDAGKFVGKIVGDIWDYIENPGKLVDMVIGKIGGVFDGIGGFTGNLGKAAFNQMKKALVNKVKEWFEENSGGDGIGGVLDPSLINYHFGHTAAYTAATGRPFHEGVDFPFVYQEVGTPMGGTLKRQSFMNGGYGNWIKVVSGAVELIFAHLKNFSKSPADGTHVKPGQIVGLTGNTGFSTGPHLHFGRRVNGRDVDPEPWLWELKKKGRLKGPKGSTHAMGSGPEYARGVIKEAQRILGGRYMSASITENMMQLAKRESNYQPNVVNDWDVNARNGDPSRGLFQIIGSTFRANAKPGHTDFSSPVDQAVSAMRYIVNRYGWGGFPRAAAYAYENGGLVTQHQVAEIGEGNKPEMVIPLTKRSRAIQLIEQAMRIIGMDHNGTNVTVNNDNSNVELLLNQIANLQEQNNQLTATLIEVLKAKPTGITKTDVYNANREVESEKMRLDKLIKGA